MRNTDYITTLEREARTANSTFAIGGVSCSADSFVVKGSLVLRINICGKNRQLLVAAFQDQKQIN